MVGLATLAAAPDSAYHLDTAQTSVKFPLGDVLHTVRGSFQLKEGALQVEANGKVSRQIVVDAASGESGSSARGRLQLQAGPLGDGSCNVQHPRRRT